MMLALAKKTDQRQPVTRQWKAKVRAKIEDSERGTFTRLAEEIGSSTGKLGDLLSDGDRSPKTSPLVGPINRFFGWSEWNPPTDAEGADRLFELYEGLDATHRELLIVAAEMLSSKIEREFMAAFLRAAQARRGAANG
jgi:hypothetical protein